MKRVSVRTSYWLGAGDTHLSFTSSATGGRKLRDRGAQLKSMRFARGDST